MSGPVDRAARRLLHRRVLSAFLLCVLAGWFADMAGTYRVANPYLALTVLAGMSLLALTALLLARRVATATPSSFAGHLLELVARYAPLLVLNLMALNVVAPVLGFVATKLINMPVLRTYLTLLGALSGQVLFWLFVLAVVSVLVVAAMRLLDQAALRWRPVGWAATIADRAIIVSTALYCAGAMALTFNGSFDSLPAVEHRSEILRVWGVPNTMLWWVDVRSWESPGGGVKRVLVFPERDHVVATLLAKGQHVRVRVRPGLLRIPWVQSMRLDFEHELEPLVAVAPSAAAPRKWLIETLLRDARWADAVQHTQAYARYHAGDRAFVTGVADALRAARQTRPAADVDRLVVPVSQTRSGR